jgi:hypothetical protein
VRDVGLTDRWDGRDDLAKLQLIQDGCFTSGIKTNLPQQYLKADLLGCKMFGAYHQYTCKVWQHQSLAWIGCDISMKARTHFFLSKEARK